MISFKNLQFEMQERNILLTRCGNLCRLKSRFAEVQAAGENKDTHMGAKMANSSEGGRLRYV